MQYFNIQVASQLSGVASATIRAWEKRYKAVVPDRGDNRHRLYSDKDIEKLGILHKLTDFGQSIGKIAHLDLEELKKLYSSLMNRPYEELSVVKTDSEPIDFDKMLNNFFIALEAYKLDIISHELEKAKNSLSPKDLCLKLLVPLFHQIGFKVFREELSIAQEHTLSAIFSFHIGQMIGVHYQKAHQKDELVLITTPEGEMHEIGILASSLLCVHHGVKFIYLGPNLPAKSLAEAANALNPKAILIGVIKGHELTDHQTIEDYLSETIKFLVKKPQIWVGGNLRPYIVSDLERKKIPFFPSLEAFDQFLEKNFN